MTSELYLVRSPYVFMGVSCERGSTSLSVVGVPFDSTSSFRGGARFAPISIRVASQSLEAYSLRTGIDLESSPPYDEGDIAVVHGDTAQTLRNVAVVSEELAKEGRKLFIMGGEHIITYGVIEGIARGLRKSPCVILFDAHMDLRNDYLGYRLSHACTSRRILEIVGKDKLFMIGIRAVSKQEISTAKEFGIRYLTSYELRRKTMREVINNVLDFLSTCSSVYVSVDMDVIDPSYAPGVATPEPEGITPSQLMDILWRITNGKFIGYDLTEVNPLVDSANVTSFLAAKILMEAMTFVMANETS